MTPKKTYRRVGWTLLTAVIVCYLGALGWFRANESKFIYSPTKGLVATSDSSSPMYQLVEITSSDSIKLVCLILPALPMDSSATWILYLHGNAYNIFGARNLARYRMLQDLKVNILAVDYRGYGNSGGEPSESGLYRDAEAGYNYLRTVKNVPYEKIVIYGWSLGSGVATELATRVPAAGLVLEGAFKSIGAVGQENYPYLPVHLILGQRFDSIEKIGRVTMPKLFIHAVDDETVPIAHGRALYDKAPAPKTFLEVTGGHASDVAKDKSKFLLGISGFLKQVFPQ